MTTEGLIGKRFKTKDKEQIIVLNKYGDYELIDFPKGVY